MESNIRRHMLENSVAKGGDNSNLLTPISNRVSYFDETPVKFEEANQTLKVVSSEYLKAIEDELAHFAQHPRQQRVLNGKSQQMLVGHVTVKRIEHLGAGSQAKVYKCRVDQISEQVFVSKTTQINNNHQLALDKLNELVAEFIIAQDLQHPNVVEYKYFIRKYDANLQNYNFHILVEYMQGGDLNQFICRNGPAKSISLVQSFLRQISGALDYLHNERQMVHKDIKPHNILLDKSAKTFKLGDLGVSTHLTKTLCTKEAS